jgi:large subunit ribosomal protein L19
MIDKETLEKIKPGARVRVYEKGGEAGKEWKSQFEGLVLARKHGNEAGATFTVRHTIAGIGVEKVYLIHTPTIVKVEIVNSPRKVHRAKLYYLRDRSRKQVRRLVGSHMEKSGDIAGISAAEREVRAPEVKTERLAEAPVNGASPEPTSAEA